MCGPCGESLDIHHSLEDILYFPVVHNISVGDTINISMKSVHRGQFYFRLCNIFDMDKCFTRQKLYILESEDYVYKLIYDDVDINLTIQLPDNVTASRYVLQWNFVSGMSTQNTHIFLVHIKLVSLCHLLFKCQEFER